MRIKSLLLAIVVFFMIPQAAAAIEVFVSIAPQKWLVDSIGKDLVTTSTLVGEGQDPHTFEPTPRQMIALSTAMIYFTIDMEFEHQLVAKLKQSKPDLRFVNSAENVEKMAMTADHHDDDTKEEETGHHHSHAGHDHSQETLDPHVWLSPTNLKIMAGEIAGALSIADPDNSSHYRTNLARLNEKLESLNENISRELAPFAGRSFFVFHPSFGYFAKAYNLHQKAVEISGNSPSPRQLTQLITQARKDGARVIFVQPQFDARSAQAVAEAIDGEVVPLDALAEDVFKNLEIMTYSIKSSLNR